jgi:hypothetical protein
MRRDGLESFARKFDTSGSSKLSLFSVNMPHDEGLDTGSLVLTVVAVSFAHCLAVSVVLLERMLRSI